MVWLPGQKKNIKKNHKTTKTKQKYYFNPTFVEALKSCSTDPESAPSAQVSASQKKKKNSTRLYMYQNVNEMRNQGAFYQFEVLTFDLLF